MNKTILRILTSLILLILATPVCALAQNDDDEELEIVSSKERNRMVGKITAKLTEWESVELNGKLKMDLLPLNPTVKIYMKKDESIMVSVRAPFVGEVARLEADKKGAILVNKMKKKYSRIDLSSFAANAPVTIGDLQDILLGRIFLLGSGTITPENVLDVDIYGNDKLGYAVVPVEQPEKYGVSYGFETSAAGETTTFIVTAGEEAYVIADYLWGKKGYDIGLSAFFNNKNLEAGMSLDTPKWGAQPMEAFKIDDKYRKVGLKELLR